jgi:hypothetical protein
MVDSAGWPSIFSEGHPSLNLFCEECTVEASAERAAEERGDPEHPELVQGPAAVEDGGAGGIDA